MPREYTTDEIRTKLLEHIWHMIDYWEKEDRPKDVRERLEGLAHSILATLDGASGEVPSFIVAPLGHLEDKAFYKSQGENWYPCNEKVPVKGDIGGALHELLYPVGRAMGACT